MYAEKAGDLMQAATMFQEAGELRQGRGTLLPGRVSSPRPRRTSRWSTIWRGPPRPTSGPATISRRRRRFEAVGGDKERLATLYEKGGDCYAAGRLFVKLGQLDRALNVLQQVDPASPNYASASLLVGMIFLKRGLTDLAREKFLKIIDNQPVGKSNLEPYYFLALCHEQAGEAENARVDLLEDPRRGLQLPGRQKAAGTEVARPVGGSRRNS